MALLSKLGKFLLDAIFPPRCPLCGEMIFPEQKTCEQCAGQVVSILPPVCERCGRPEGFCRCGDSAYSFARCVSPFAYRSVIRKGIHRLKFEQGTSSARYFAEAMAATVRREYGSETIDFLVCVPMYTQKWPEYDENSLTRDEVEIAVQVNGKVRGKLMIPTATTRESAQEELPKLDSVKALVGDKQIVKVIFVPGRLLNIVVK